MAQTCQGKDYSPTSKWGTGAGLLVKIHLKIRCAFLSILFARALLSILVEICSNFDRNEMQWHSLLLQHIPPQVSRQKHCITCD